jgi:hypothetical protein
VCESSCAAISARTTFDIEGYCVRQVPRPTHDSIPPLLFAFVLVARSSYRSSPSPPQKSYDECSRNARPFSALVKRPFDSR